MGHFVSSPREREKRDRRDTCSRREEQGRKRNRNEREETEEIKTVPLYLYLLQGQQALPNCKPISVGHPGDTIHDTFAPPDHPLKPSRRVPNAQGEARGSGKILRNWCIKVHSENYL